MNALELKKIEEVVRNDLYHNRKNYYELLTNKDYDEIRPIFLEGLIETAQLYIKLCESKKVN